MGDPDGLSARSSETGSVRAHSSYGQIPVQPGRHGHGGVAAELAAHHLKPRLPGGQSLGKAHLLRPFLARSSSAATRGCTSRGHGRGDQKCDVFVGR